jgi:hypothetical protein
MEYAIGWGGNPEDIRMTTHGVAQVRDFDAMWRAAVADSRWVEGMKVLVDHTRLDWTELVANDIRERAELMKQQSEAIGRQQVAFVVDDSRSLRLGRLMGYVLDWQVGFVARYFTSLAEARAWLREPRGLPHVSPPP